MRRESPRVLLLLALAGCGLSGVLPGPAVVTGPRREAFEASLPAQVGGQPIAYTSGPAVGFTVLPLQVWGLRYALDLVAVSDHPDWVMHEYAKIQLPGRTIWMAKDAGLDREQTIVADIPDIEGWVPEVPVRRISRPIAVAETADGERFSLELDYQNPHGQQTSVSYTGKLPTHPSQPRNGNTMGHSRNRVAALLDLYLFRIGGSLDLQIDGMPRDVKPLAGVVPQLFLLAQVQGGIATTNFRQDAFEDGFVLQRPGDGAPWPTRATEVWRSIGDGWVQRPDPVVDLFYRFVDGELERATAVQDGDDEAMVNIVFSPRLPDVRRRWEGIARSRFVVDINGQQGHGTGQVAGYWRDDGVELELTPTQPPWFADRPMRGRVQYAGGSAYVTMVRDDSDAP